MFQRILCESGPEDKSNLPLSGMGDVTDAPRFRMCFQMYPKASDDAINLLERLMQYDPKRRLTAAEGLQHNYCSQFHDPESEVTYAHGRVNISVHDNKKLTVSKYRDLLYEKCGDGKRK